MEDGAAATADFSAHWAKSTRSENYVKDGGTWPGPGPIMSHEIP